MLEKISVSEIPDKPNWSQSELQLIKALKEKHHPSEAMVLIHQWTEEQEKLSDDTTKGQILLNLRRARLYSAAGMIDEARENFQDTATYAMHIGLDEIYEAIIEEMRVYAYQIDILKSGKHFI